MFLSIFSELGCAPNHPKTNTLLRVDNGLYVVLKTVQGLTNQDTQVETILTLERIKQAYRCNDSEAPEADGMFIALVGEHHQWMTRRACALEELIDGVEVVKSPNAPFLLNESWVDYVAIQNFPNIYNGTSHPINILPKEECEYDPTSRKYVLQGEAKPRYIIPAGINLSVSLTETEEIPLTGYYQLNCSALSPALKIRPKFKDIDPLPEGYDLYVVSNLYLQGAIALGKDISKLATVADPVYSKDSRPIGCLSLYID
jgi:hypothetical protein